MRFTHRPFNAVQAADLHLNSGKTAWCERDVPITERARRILEARLEAAEGPCLFPKRVRNGLDWSQPMTTVKGDITGTDARRWL